MEAIRTGPRRQQGFILIISLVMLVALTLLGLGAIGLSTTNLRVINNAQMRAEGLAAIQQRMQALYSVLNIDGDKLQLTAGTTTLTAGTTTTFPAVNKDGFIVSIDRPCLSSFDIIPKSSLKPAGSSSEDDKCRQSIADSTAGLTTDSDCASTLWRFTGQARDGFFGGSNAVTEGISVRQYSAQARNLATAFACS